MGKTSDATSPSSRTGTLQVGSAEFRGNLAKYLRRAKEGLPVIVKERGKPTYILRRLDEESLPSVLGGLRERTSYSPGAIPRHSESWTAGALP